jgi:hypothetical protein
MENIRYGGGMCCPYCGKYISNAGFNMQRHQVICPKAPWADEPEISPVEMEHRTKKFLQDALDKIP